MQRELPVTEQDWFSLAFSTLAALWTCVCCACACIFVLLSVRAGRNGPWEEAARAWASSFLGLLRVDCTFVALVPTVAAADQAACAQQLPMLRPRVLWSGDGELTTAHSRCL